MLSTSGRGTPAAAPMAGATDGAHPWARRRAWLTRVVWVAAVLVGALVTLAPTGPSAGQYIAAAANARAGLRYDRALMWYAAASAQAPGDPQPYCLRGEVRALQQEYVDADAAYQHCATLDPSSAAAWLGLGDALAARGDDAGAARAWSRSSALGGTEALRRLGQWDESRGDFAAAEADWTKLPPDDPQAQVHLGLLALERGDNATARAVFVAARAEPNKYAEQIVDSGFVLLAAEAQTSAAGFGRLGYTFLAAGMPRFAIAPLRQAVALDPTEGSAHAYLGWTEWVLGQQSDARREIALGQRLAPRLSFGWFAAGELALADGNPQGALADFRHGLSLDAKNPALWGEVGRVSLVEHDYVSAELALQNAAQLSLDPTYTIAFVRFYVERHIGLDNGRALLAATTAAQRFPANETIRFLLAEVYDQIQQQSLAYYAAQQASALDPTDPGPYLLLGRYAENEGNYLTAALDLRIALALRPNGPLAAQARALLAPIADVPV